MNIVAYDRIIFTNGAELDVPVIGESTLPYGEIETFRYGNFGVCAAEIGNGQFRCIGLPEGAGNALVDGGGGLWYYTKSQSGNNGTIDIYIRSSRVTSISAQISWNAMVAVLFICRKYNEDNFTISWASQGPSSARNVGYVLGLGPGDAFPTRFQFPTYLVQGYVNWDFFERSGSYFGFMRCMNLLAAGDYVFNRGNVFWFDKSILGTGYEADVDPVEYDPFPDSNRQGGISSTGGGGGNFDRTSDTISVPQLPTLNATNAGFVTLYKPTLSQLVNLADYLWSNNILNILISYFSNPMDIIIGLGIMPVSAPASTSGYPSAGAITIPISLPIYDSQYYTLDCGSITINEFWGSALDYAPYTKISIYLPYVGVRVIDTDEVMGHTVGVIYHIDLFGGACIAFVTVDGSVKYQFSGECMQQIPINAANYDQLVQNLVSLACVVGSGIAAAGSAGVAAAVAEESQVLGAGSLSTPQAIGKGLVGSEYAEFRGMGAKEWLADGGGKSLMNCTVNTVMSSKPTVERTGCMGATTGQLSIQTPYLIIERPEQSLPNNYRHYAGYPSNITSKLGKLEGFTVVDSIRLNDLAATQPELIEIYSLLKKGVII